MSAALAPLRERNFRWYFLARFVNTAGSMMAPIALTFAVLDLTDSPTALGQVLAAATIPLVLFLLVGGVIADRFDRARVIRTCNVIAGLTQATAATLIVTGTAELWHLIVLEAVNGTVLAAAFPAMASVVPQLVPRDQLQQANVLLSMTRGSLAVVGPSVAAILVVTVGPGWALAVDAATWLLAAGFVARVSIPPRAASDQTPNALRELRDGWSVFVGHTWLWVVVLAFAFLNGIHTGAWFTLGPALAKDTIGEQGWGYVLSAEAVGLLLATVVLLRLRFTRPLKAGMLGMVAFGLPLFALGLDLGLTAMLVAAFLAGIGIEIFGLGWNLAMQENIDEEVLSRAYSYDALGSFVAMPVGQLVYGPLGEAFGFRDVILVSAVAYVAVALLTLTSGSVRNLPRRRTEEPTETPV